MSPADQADLSRDILAPAWLSRLFAAREALRGTSLEAAGFSFGEDGRFTTILHHGFKVGTTDTRSREQVSVAIENNIGSAVRAVAEAQLAILRDRLVLPPGHALVCDVDHQLRVMLALEAAEIRLTVVPERVPEQALNPNQVHGEIHLHLDRPYADATLDLRLGVPGAQASLIGCEAGYPKAETWDQLAELLAETFNQATLFAADAPWMSQGRLPAVMSPQGRALPASWSGVAMDAASAGRFWALGPSSGGAREARILVSTELTAALREADLVARAAREDGRRPCYVVAGPGAETRLIYRVGPTHHLPTVMTVEGIDERVSPEAARRLAVALEDLNLAGPDAFDRHAIFTPRLFAHALPPDQPVFQLRLLSVGSAALADLRGEALIDEVTRALGEALVTFSAKPGEAGMLRDGNDTAFGVIDVVPPGGAALSADQSLLSLQVTLGADPEQALSATTGVLGRAMARLRAGERDFTIRDVDGRLQARVQSRLLELSPESPRPDLELS